MTTPSIIEFKINPVSIPVCTSTVDAIRSERAAHSYASSVVGEYARNHPFLCCYVFQHGQYAGSRCSTKLVLPALNYIQNSNACKTPCYCDDHGCGPSRFSKATECIEKELEEFSFTVREKHREALEAFTKNAKQKSS